ncbi:MAG: hypothetical protein HONDAALG_02418 [Gammaproteobacteria bacterium]|nr:hypothetical protein [Gammaproteobacteria bacterium]
MRGAFIRWGRWPRVVERQLCHGEIAIKLPPPIVELSVKRFPLKPLPLPVSEVGVLNRQFRQRRGAVLAEGVVERRKFARQRAQRPFIADDVMHRKQRDVFFRSQPQQANPEQRALSQIERPQRILGGHLPDLLFSFDLGIPAQFHHRQRQRKSGSDDLNRLPINSGEGCAQALVTPDDLVDAGFQRGHVQFTCQTNGAGHVVSRIARLHLINEPQTLLSERQWQCAEPRYRLNRRRRRPLSGLHQRLDSLGQSGHSWRFKQFARRHLDLKRLAHPGDKLSDEQ